jgi:hypothetical protein
MKGERSLGRAAIRSLGHLFFSLWVPWKLVVLSVVSFPAESLAMQRKVEPVSTGPLSRWGPPMFTAPPCKVRDDSVTDSLNMDNLGACMRLHILPSHLRGTPLYVRP